MIILNPANGNVRNDYIGKGFFHAPRRNGTKRYLHKGVDFEIADSSPVVSPISGQVTRTVQVYPNSTKYVGCEIHGLDICIKLFYVVLNKDLLKEIVQQGQILGHSQDKNHIHMEVTWVSPLLLM